jgi:hypothetical protein
MQAEYPFGQCYQCGARWVEWRCAFGTVHIVAAHSEGGCSMWRDSGDGPSDPDEKWCPEGCYQPGLWTGMEMAMLTLPPATVFSYVAAPAFSYADDDLDSLPF